MHPPPQNDPGSGPAIETAERWLRQGEPLLAYNVIQEGLQASPENLRLHQLKGLAIARSGDIERANQLLRELADEGSADAETLGMLARTHKDLAMRTQHAAERDRHLDSAFRIYNQGYDAARHANVISDASYTGINAAAVAVLRGDLPTARRIAGEVRELALAAPAAGEAADYWHEATLGEAALILGQTAESMARYAHAATLARGNFGNLSSTRRQAELLAERLPGGGAWVRDVLRIAPIVMYTGHMLDRATRAQPRFPAALEEVVAAAVRQRFDSLRPIAAYGSAACGADILCLEAMQELGGETHIVLPFPAAQFREVSVDCAPGNWGDRFERAVARATSVTLTSEHRARGSNAPYEYANYILSGMARLRAQGLQTQLHALAVWDGRANLVGGAASGGAASVVHLWQTQGVELAEVRLGELQAGSPVPGDGAEDLPGDAVPVAGFTHEIRAMLFADAVGYSRLSEDQTPNFITQFLGAVAGLIARTEQRPEHVETTGDGLYMVFRSVRDAGLYALQLSHLVAATDWSARGLPDGLNIRIALHCGPVHCGRNPITGSPLYTGPHTSRTARIEPITPPGQVYASSAFAAVAAGLGVDDLSMQYVGRMPLAKGYGLLGIYHVRAGKH